MQIFVVILLLGPSQIYAGANDGYVEDLSDDYAYEEFMSKGPRNIQEPEREIVPATTAPNPILEKSPPIDLSRKMKSEWAILEASKDTLDMPKKEIAITNNKIDDEIVDLESLFKDETKTKKATQKKNMYTRSRTTKAKTEEISEDFDLNTFEKTRGPL